MDSLSNPKIDVSSAEIRKRRRGREVGVKSSLESGLVTWGPPLKDVLSIRIYRKTGADRDVKIYGAIWIERGGKVIEYLFKRNKYDPQKFKSPGKELTLALKGPVDSSILHGDFHFCLLGVLICDGEAIFSRSRCSEYFLNEYKVGLENIFKGGDNVFDEKGDVGIGFGYCSLPYVYMPPGVFTLKIDAPYFNSRDPIDYMVEAVIVSRPFGMVGKITFTACRDLCLYGEIRACQVGESETIVLFQENKGKPVCVNRSEQVLLSRSMAVVSIGSCLEIKFEKVGYNQDDDEISATIKFFIGDTSPKSVRDVFTVDVEWSDAGH